MEEETVLWNHGTKVNVDQCLQAILTWPILTIKPSYDAVELLQNILVL